MVELERRKFDARQTQVSALKLNHYATKEKGTSRAVGSRVIAAETGGQVPQPSRRNPQGFRICQFGTSTVELATFRGSVLRAQRFYKALIAQHEIGWRKQTVRMGFVLIGLKAGIAVYAGYEWYKFPPGTTAEHAEILSHYMPAFPGTPLAAVLVLLFSPGASMFLYCPTLFLSLRGMAAGIRSYPLFTGTLALGAAVFFGFICSLRFFTGELSWGPRYLTPIFALLWIFLPAAAALVRRRLVVLSLGLGLLVQLLALSVSVHRFYVELSFPSGFIEGDPWIYFHPRISHLLYRPREIQEIVTEDKSATREFSPASLPNSALPCPEFMERGPAAVRKYRVLNSFRPWWASMIFLPTVMGRWIYMARFFCCCLSPSWGEG